MKEIKEGEYVRTETGYIGKVIEVLSGAVAPRVQTERKAVSTMMITKHSPNIIDLIEKNDIAEVLDNWTGNKQIIYIYDDRDISELKLDIKNGFLKLLSITTAKQFNQVKYEV